MLLYEVSFSTYLYQYCAAEKEKETVDRGAGRGRVAAVVWGCGVYRHLV